jgi:hypothetical protein
MQSRNGGFRNVPSRSAINALRKLLSTVVLVKEVMDDLLEISQMAVKKGGTDGQEVRVTWVIDLNNTPWVLARANLAASDLNDVLGTNNGEWHESSQLSVLLDGILIVLLDVVGEVVDGDAVVLDILHNKLLGLGELGGSQGVGATDDGDNVDTRGEALHQLDVEFSQTKRHMSAISTVVVEKGNEPVTSRCDKVKEGVDTVVPEAGVTLDTGLLSKNIIVLSLKVALDLGEAERAPH